MSLKFKNNGVTSDKLTEVIFKNGSTTTNLTEIIMDGNYVWCKPFTYTRGTLPTGVLSLTCHRISSNEPDAFVGEVPDGGRIYYGDKLYFSATFEEGYNVDEFDYNSSSDPYTVTGDIIGVTITRISTSRKTYSIRLKKGQYAIPSYSINGATPQTFVDVSLTLDYGDTLVVTATGSSEAPYNYSEFYGIGTYTYEETSRTITIYRTRTVKSFTFTLTKNTGVESISISRTSSPYQGASTGVILNNTGTATIYYGDVLEGLASPSTGYTLSGDDSYTNSGVTGNDSWSPVATRITWKLRISKNDYIASVTYSINGGSSQSVSSIVTLTLDYSDYVDVSATTQSEAPYDYGTPTNTGRYTYRAGTQYAFVSCTRSVKQYQLTISVNTEVYGSYSVRRTSSPYQGASIGDLSNGATIYYGDVIESSVSPWSRGETHWDDWPTIRIPTATLINKNSIGALNNTGYNTVDFQYKKTSQAESSYATFASQVTSGSWGYVYNLEYSTSYNIRASKSWTRSGWYYYYESNSGTTVTVYQNTTITIEFYRYQGSETQTETLYSTSAVVTTQSLSKLTAPQAEFVDFCHIEVYNPNSVTCTVTAVGVYSESSTGSYDYEGDNFATIAPYTRIILNVYPRYEWHVECDVELIASGYQNSDSINCVWN